MKITAMCLGLVCCILLCGCDKEENRKEIIGEDNNDWDYTCSTQFKKNVMMQASKDNTGENTYDK